MALDESNQEDSIITEQGVTFVIEKGLLEKAQPIRVDFSESDAGAGFILTSNLPKEGTCC